MQWWLRLFLVACLVFTSTTSSAHEITLLEFVNLALQNHPSIAQAEALMTQARSELISIKNKLNVAFNASVQHNLATRNISENVVLAAHITGRDGVDYQIQVYPDQRQIHLQLTRPLLIPTEYLSSSRAVVAAERAIKEQEINYYSIKEQVIIEALYLYFNIEQVRQQIELYQEWLSILEQKYQTWQDAHQYGLVTSAEMNQIVLQCAQKQKEITALTKQLELYHAWAASLYDLSGQIQLAAIGEIELYPLYELVPEIIAVDVALALLKCEWTDYELAAKQAAEGMTAHLEAYHDADSWVIGVNVHIPLIDPSKSASQINAQIQRNQTELLLAKAQMETLYRYQEQELRLVTAKDRLDAAVAAFKLAQAQLYNAQQQLNDGAINLVQLLTSKEQLLMCQLEMLQAQDQYRKAFVDHWLARCRWEYSQKISDSR